MVECFPAEVSGAVLQERPIPSSAPRRPRYDRDATRRALDAVDLLALAQRIGVSGLQRTGRTWRLTGVPGRPDVVPTLYRLPALLAADPGAPVYVVEGEKCADALAALGLVSTTNSGGAGHRPDAGAAYLAGRDVVILPD